MNEKMEVSTGNQAEIGKKKKEKFTEKEKIRAAYALNMCMVSISQIIDYSDVYILEQEYDGILNNLNLEMMPKDKALLKIIKQILDTITFFRIEEGEKKFIDREYQQKMKDAIWKAVPNFGLIVAGGNPVSMAISLASQVGIGYMNYRRAKSENTLEYEKQLWGLQKSAIEQFNGLRRELFDTAWRLADKYEFPDDYRLTERQIDQYNEILMDSDEIRKYERLTTIQDKFIAYPPFWYQYGSTANHISWNMDIDLSQGVREDYRSKALEHFRQFWVSNEYALLREDQVASACALEQIDLLDVKEDAQEIKELIQKALKHSGDKNDILQLCAVANLRIGDINDAAILLRRLVNEEYNTVVNAQMLSVIYVNKALQGDQDARYQYELLARRIDPDYLVRLPEIGVNEDRDALLDDFNKQQEEMLQEKYNAVIDYVFNNFVTKLTKVIPVIDPGKKYPEYYFRTEGVALRSKDFDDLFHSKYKEKKREEYRERIAESGLINGYFDLLNTFYDEIMSLDCIRESQKIQEIIEDKIINASKDINIILGKINDRQVDYDDICKLMAYTSFEFFEEAYKELKKQIEVTIIGYNTMEKFAASDSALRSFCIKYKVPEPENLLKVGNEKYEDQSADRAFKLEMLGKEGERIQKEQEIYKGIEKVIKRYLDKLNGISKKANAYLHDTEEFNSFFNGKGMKKNRSLIRKTIAVYDDKSLSNTDILFTVDGVIPIVHGKEKTKISYFSLVSANKQDNVTNRLKEALKSEEGKDFLTKALEDPVCVAMSIGPVIKVGIAYFDNKMVEDVLNSVRPMFDDISNEILRISED